MTIPAPDLGRPPASPMTRKTQVNGESTSVRPLFGGLHGSPEAAAPPAGRNEPGTGKLDLEHYLDPIAATGYDGWVGLEYKPSGASADSFDWLPRDRRSSH